MLSEGQAPASSAPEFPCTGASQEGLPLPASLPHKAHSPGTTPEGRRHKVGHDTPTAPVPWDQEATQNCREEKRPALEGSAQGPPTGNGSLAGGKAQNWERTVFTTVCILCRLGKDTE